MKCFYSHTVTVFAVHVITAGGSSIRVGQ